MTWRPPAILKVSAALHAAGVLALAIDPASWPPVLALIVGNHVLLIAVGFFPRGRLLGPNLVRLPCAAAERGEVALTFDDGPDPDVTPRILELLDRYHMKATFFCIGTKARAHRTIVEEIVRCGHAVENHSFDHPHTFAMLGPARMRRQIDAAQGEIASIAGEPPRFFRAPAGLRSPWLDPLLMDLGLRYVSWTRRGFDTVRSNAQAVTRALTRNLTAGDVLLLHDGNCRRTASGEPIVLAVLPAVLEALESRGLKSVALRTAFES